MTDSIVSNGHTERTRGRSGQGGGERGAVPAGPLHVPRHVVRRAPLLLPGLRPRAAPQLLHHQPRAAERVEAVPHRLRRQGQVRRPRRQLALPARRGGDRRRHPRWPGLTALPSREFGAAGRLRPDKAGGPRSRGWAAGLFAFQVAIEGAAVGAAAHRALAVTPPPAGHVLHDARGRIAATWRRRRLVTAAGAWLSC